MPGCVLRAAGPSFTPRDFVAKFPVAYVTTRGDALNISISDRDGDEFDGQVADAIEYLKVHEDAIRVLLSQTGMRANLDFGVWNKEQWSQSCYFPVELVKLAGALSLGLEITTYGAPRE
jgi:hypothetical protein